MFYSVKRTPTSILEDLRRVDTSKRSSASLYFEDEHSLNTKHPPAVQWDRNLPCRLIPTPQLNSPLTKSALDASGLVSIL